MDLIPTGTLGSVLLPLQGQGKLTKIDAGYSTDKYLSVVGTCLSSAAGYATEGQLL